VTYGSTI